MKKIKHKLHRVARKGKSLRKSEQAPASSGAPRITNQTVAEHREEVLSDARKYIYPLQHSRHRIVVISLSIITIAIVCFFTYTIFALYKSRATSTFIYRVTQVLPFPIAKAGSNFVAYENYLFEVRRYMHYYETQQDVDFDSKSGQDQLAVFEKQALDGIIQDTYVKQLAKEHNVKVSGAEVNAQIALLKEQNRLGGSNQVFSDVLKEFWNWSVDDFKRELHMQLLTQKVASKLDIEAHKKAETVLAQAQAGGDFAALAAQYSDDASTKGNGGEYGIEIEQTNRDILPQVMQQLFALQPGQVSGIIETPTGLEIVKVLENNNGKVKAAHIAISFKPISTFVEPLEKQNPPRRFISL